jgi:hypothetical protein
LAEHFLGGVDAAGVVAGVDEGLEGLAILELRFAILKDSAGDGETAGGRAAGGDVTSGEIGGIGGVELGGARIHDGEVGEPPSNDDYLRSSASRPFNQPSTAWATF